jgi:hypothetical protein
VNQNQAGDGAAEVAHEHHSGIKMLVWNDIPNSSKGKIMFEPGNGASIEPLMEPAMDEMIAAGMTIKPLRRWGYL